VENASVDWNDRQSVIDYIVGYDRMLAGGRRPFDEDARRELVSADFDRAHDYAAIQNHDAVAAEPGEPGPLAGISVPTLVIHGTADPMFPIAHGEALAREIPEANLVRLEGAGHGLLPADWERVAKAILANTAGA
jgi:pimeloyl-ACP methyl ester carboxylesterase